MAQISANVQDTTITVAFEEMEGSPRERVTEDGFQAQRKLKCAWADRLTLMDQLPNRSESVGDDIVYIRGHLYPGKTDVYCYQCSCEPLYDKDVQLGSASGIAKYTYAVITADYKQSTLGDISNDVETLVTESIDSAIDTLMLPKKGLYWTTGANKKALTLDESPHAVRELFTWVYTMHSLPTIPDWFFTLVGRVNDSAVTSLALKRTFEAETLLYGPPTCERIRTTAGIQAWNATVRFVYDPDGWNKFPRGGYTGRYTIYDAAGDVWRAYPTADFTVIQFAR